jgi:hypothetical protein
MAKHAGRPAPEPRPLTTGRLAVWLTFWLFIEIMVLSTVVGIASEGVQ